MASISICDDDDDYTGVSHYVNKNNGETRVSLKLANKKKSQIKTDSIRSESASIWLVGL